MISFEFLSLSTQPCSEVSNKKSRYLASSDRIRQRSALFRIIFIQKMEFKVLYFPPVCELCRGCCSKNIIFDMISYRNLCIKAGVLLKLAVKHKAINIHRNIVDLILGYVFWQKPMKLYRQHDKYHMHTNHLVKWAEIKTTIFPTLVPAYFIEATANIDNNDDLAGYPICESYKVVGRVVSSKLNRIRGVCWVPRISVESFDVSYHGRMEIYVISLKK